MIKQINRLRPLFSRRDKLLYVALLLLMIGGAFVDVAGVGAIPAFVAALAVPEKVMAYPAAARVLDMLGITETTELVLWGCLALGVIFILKNAYLAFLHFAQVRITEYHRVRMSSRLFSAYMRAPYEFQLKRNSAELLRNVQGETKEIFTGIINPVLHVVMGGLMTAGIVVLLVATTPGVAFIGLGIVGGGSWVFLRIFRTRLQRYGQEAKHERKESIKAVNQGLGAFVDARILGREGHLIQAFVRSMAHLAYVDRLRQVISKSSNPVLETISVLGLLLIVVALVLTGWEPMAMVPLLALFGAATVRLRASLSEMITGISQIHYSIAAVSNVTDDLNLLEDKALQRKGGRKHPKKEAVQRLPFQHALVLDGVSYTYPETTEPALRDISLTIEKGTSVAFVGSTGSGKTTLINVILGLLRPQQGTIQVDGADIFSNLRGWNENVGYIPQTIFLLDDTIRRNIAFGLPDEKIDSEKLQAAVRAAQLEEFVASLPEGLETVVGERGVRLSGGQRQRVGLARALYHNPEVLIMDEATSALDNQTENLVMQALEELKEGRTFIIIAHRLSTVRECDRLYFLRDGRVEAEGTFEDLTHRHVGFRRMAEVA